jgi:hypothetical protein
MITLSIELTEDAEKRAFGVGVTVGVSVETGVAVDGTRLASVLVAGGVMDGNSVSVGGTNIVAVGVQVGSSWRGVIVGEGVKI